MRATGCASREAGARRSAAGSFLGNPLLRSDVVALKREPQPPPAQPGPTRMLQAPWSAIFSRLEPALRRPPGGG